MADRDSSRPSRPARAKSWRVTVNKPGPNDGNNWRLRYRAPDGTVTHRTSGTKDRAQADEIARLAELELRTEDGETGDMRLVQLVDLYLADAGDELAANTRANYRSARLALEAAAPDARVSDVSPEWIASLRQRLRGRDGKPLRASTADLYLRSIRAAWSWARERPGRTGVKIEWVSPRRRGRKAQAAAARTIKRPYTPAELTAIVEELRGHPLWLLFRVLADTGPRIDELRPRTADDVSTDVHGHTWLHLPETKTGRPRSIPLLPDLAELLPSSGFLFCATEKGRRPAKNSVDRALAEAIAAAGVENTPRVKNGRRAYPLDIHSFRRSWVAHAKLAKIPTPTAMLITGHEPEGVHDGYARGHVPDPGELHAAVETLRRWRAGQQPDPPGQPLDPTQDPPQNPPQTHNEAGHGNAVSPDGTKADPTCRGSKQRRQQTRTALGLRGTEAESPPQPRGGDEGREGPQGAILDLGRPSVHALALGRALATDEQLRAAIVALALDRHDLRAGVLDAAREWWPGLLPERDGQERRA